MGFKPRRETAAARAASASPRHVVAISLLGPRGHNWDEAMDQIAGAFNGNPYWLNPDRAGDDRVVWRVSSIDDLARRLFHLADGSLRVLDIVGHAKPGRIGVGVMADADADVITSSRDSFAPLAVLRDKLDADADPCLRLIGCRVGAYYPATDVLEPSESGPALLLALSQFLGATVKGVTCPALPTGATREETARAVDDLPMATARHHVSNPTVDFVVERKNPS